MASTSSSPAGPAEADSPVVHVAFSSGASHFVAFTATGFHVFSCDESVERVRYKSIADVSDGAEVTSAEMLTWLRLAVVTRKTGGTEHEAIYFFDEESKRTIRISSAKTPGIGVVGGVRLLGDHAPIAGQEMAMLVVRGDIKNSELVATGPNPLGLWALAVDQRTTAFVYALPRPEKGAAQVRRGGHPGSVDVRAHASSVSCIALSRDGRLLATAGSKGTLVRIFSTGDGTKLQELRRGIDRADIHCIAFSPDSRWLAVSSGKGTVHVFPVDKATSTTEGGDGDALSAPPAATASSPAPATAKQGSSLPSFLKGYLPSYFSSEWSLAQARLREGVEYTVEFWRQDPNVILIAGTDGSFYRCRFDPTNTGEMKQLDCKRFIKIKESEGS